MFNRLWFSHNQFINHLLINDLNQQAPKNQKRFVGLVQMYQSFPQTEHFQLDVFAQFRRFAPEDSSFSQIQLAQALPYSRRKLDMIANELYQKGMLEKAQQKPLIYTMSTNYLNLLSQR